MASDPQANFNRIYHHMRAGETSPTNETWMSLFDDLADHILMDLRPGSVLDAGCGRGYLVNSLRRQGVEAWGIDTSAAAVRDALPESQPFCQVGSILDPLPRAHYDLIVCIDILEHYPPLEAIKAVENLCRYTDDILLSCTPIENPGSASINVQPPEYWMRLLERFGFIHDLEFDGTYIAPWAMRLVKAQPPAEERLSAYERKIWLLSQEVALRREVSLEYKNELARKEMELQYWREASKRLQSELNAIRNSASWKLTTRLQHFRERTIPLGSRREKVMRSILRGYGILRREGILRGSVFAEVPAKVFLISRNKSSV
jgi:SAM-dependent methyltransferase